MWYYFDAKWCKSISKNTIIVATMIIKPLKNGCFYKWASYKKLAEMRYHKGF